MQQFRAATQDSATIFMDYPRKRDYWIVQKAIISPLAGLNGAAAYYFRHRPSPPCRQRRLWR